jgi:hypothetical protein
VQVNHAGWNNSGMAADGLSWLVGKMLAAPLRYVSRLAFVSPLVKAGAHALFLVTWFMPRRLPDLARFTASPQFGSCHAPAVEWAGRQFGLIQAGAPWLDLAGRWVDDYCQVRIDKGVDFHLAGIGAECFRNLTAVYGADGALPARLSDLDRVLGAAGWGDFFSYGAAVIPQGSLGSQQQPPVSGHWQQAPGSVSSPAGLDTPPPAGERRLPGMRIGWTSRGQPADPQWTLDGRWHAGGTAVPSPPREASLYCHRVDCNDADVDELASHALAAHEHAIVIVIAIGYYFNPDLRRFPMPRRILPSVPGRLIGSAHR